MTLAMAKMGERVRIRAITGSDLVKRHLGSLGFVPGVVISVIQLSYGNMIVGIHESRIAVDGALAHRIQVQGV